MNDTPLNGHDKEGLAGLPPVMAQIAARYGRGIFEATMTINTINYGLQELEKQARGNQRVMKTLIVTSAMIRQLAAQLVTVAGWELQQLESCRLDVERAADLGATTEQKSSIILTH